MHKLHIKVCGLTRLDDLPRLEAMGVDFAGMIFYPSSPRSVVNLHQANLARSYHGHLRKVGVFVNATFEMIEEAVATYGLQVIQLHGEETPAYCCRLRELGLVLIKAFPVASDQFPDTQPYQASCDYFLFDTASVKKGGTGKRFDWQKLDAYQGKTPFFLSGGIGLEHVPDILSLKHPQLYGVDINSRFEIAPGIKDLEQIKQFICQLNTVLEA
jgi:phosphoribosylanthranilate isomerase